ncbi:hypothetical protein FFM54_14840 [Burkholderia pseudomallei]|uniref:Uncharacterized protein n=1 Tax=Burkholderia pseudomallei TaxID=28450 RepID=A0AAX0U8S9_BURPE|nr:hypothetical protein BHT10_33515 [Burkholderia pseudomallei]EEC38511.1 conserved hypothetical protein [Burkholderia pseudomallei 576]EES23700.1 hypothetical protein BURPS1106B_0476 [Burkholderia pseudomallei 1106b]AYX04276.1 hypothetical protein EGY14_10965 [Burkholderia pseudomallei]PJO57296.1 hypothetical protein CWD85_21985 [Burkholderia pseudomallei]
MIDHCLPACAAMPSGARGTRARRRSIGISVFRHAAKHGRRAFQIKRFAVSFANRRQKGPVTRAWHNERMTCFGV